ncbi:synaptotagmin-C [Polyodon spathula]|uniref:synaptotagmin-C n=1 Tax=Polyodon spathula TaxID=7913 RepID=UPI001B7F14F1|nr:synaptotagmin-C [Polyodon spathula]
MSGDYEEEICKTALMLVQELCSHKDVFDSNDKCQEFNYLLSDRERIRYSEPDISVSLLSVIVTFCGIVLLGVSLFVSWKLDTKEGGNGESGDGGGGGGGGRREGGGGGGPEMPEHSYLDMDSYPQGQQPPVASAGGGVGGLKLSHTSPELPPASDSGVPPPHRELSNAHSQQQVSARTAPRPPAPRPPSPELHLDEKQDQSTSIGLIKPELYRLRAEQGGGKQGETGTCGQISFMVRYAYNTEQLVVKILKALDLPAKDSNGFSDPYVKIYLLPDRKKKFQTKVHRKTLNPVFNETFSFGVPFAELPGRKLHFSVYDFDRFSRHDLIGQVIEDRLLEVQDQPLWRNIREATASVSPSLPVSLSSPPLPPLSDPYVKVSLICEGRRLKKRKTSIKKNTLNPTYNEALVFDIPNENINQLSLIIAVMDYDCIGHNEVIGMCRVGSDAEGPGRDHWTEMLGNPRKPIEHWHQLVEEKVMNTYVSKSATLGASKPHITVESPHSE